MKVKIKDLKANPFKKEINKGALNKEQVKKIKSNIKELGLMGSLPVFKRKNQYYLICGHHRLQAMKEIYGNNHEIDVDVKAYSDDQIFRGMVIENLTQRMGEFREETENLLAIRNYLKKTCSDSEQVYKGGGRGIEIKEAGSVRDIAKWLNKMGEIMSIGKIAELLGIKDNLSPELYERVECTHEGDSSKRTDGHTISKTQAVILSRFDDHQEQKELSKALLKSREQRVRNQDALMTIYKAAPQDIKEKVRKGEIDIADIKVKEFEKNSDYQAEDYAMTPLEWINHMDKLLQEVAKKFETEQHKIKDLTPQQAHLFYKYLQTSMTQYFVPFMEELQAQCNETALLEEDNNE